MGAAMTSYITRGRQADLRDPLRGQTCPLCGGVVQMHRNVQIGDGEQAQHGDVVACSGCEWAVLLDGGEVVPWPTN